MKTAVLLLVACVFLGTASASTGLQHSDKLVEMIKAVSLGLPHTQHLTASYMQQQHATYGGALGCTLPPHPAW